MGGKGIIRFLKMECGGGEECWRGRIVLEGEKSVGGGKFNKRLF